MPMSAVDLARERVETAKRRVSAGGLVTPGAKHELEQAEVVLSALEAAAGRGPAAPSPSPCPACETPRVESGGAQEVRTRAEALFRVNSTPRRAAGAAFAGLTAMGEDWLFE